MSDPEVTWEYIGEELALFWESPYGHGKEKIATFWWPFHPPEKTVEVENLFERIFGVSALAGYLWFWHAILNHPGSLSPGG